MEYYFIMCTSSSEECLILFTRPRAVVTLCNYNNIIIIVVDTCMVCCGKCVQL